MVKDGELCGDKCDLKFVMTEITSQLGPQLTSGDSVTFDHFRLAPHPGPHLRTDTWLCCVSSLCRRRYSLRCWPLCCCGSASGARNRQTGVRFRTHSLPISNLSHVQRQPRVVCTQGQVTLLTSLEELWTLDRGDTRLSPVTGLLTRRVTQMAGGQHHLAAVTDQGQKFTWTEDSVNPVQVKLVSITQSIISRP